MKQVVTVNDLPAKNRLLLLAYIAETEPVPFGLLVTLVLSGLSMDYFAFQEALNSTQASKLVSTIELSETDVSGKRRIAYILSDEGKQVLASLENQLKPSELEWLKENAGPYRQAYDANDLSGAYYREADHGYIVSIGQAKKGHFTAHYTFFVETEDDAKKAVVRFKKHADGLNDYLKDTLLSD